MATAWSAKVNHKHNRVMNFSPKNAWYTHSQVKDEILMHIWFIKIFSVRSQLRLRGIAVRQGVFDDHDKSSLAFPLSSILTLGESFKLIFSYKQCISSYITESTYS